MPIASTYNMPLSADTFNTSISILGLLLAFIAIITSVYIGKVLLNRQLQDKTFSHICEKLDEVSIKLRSLSGALNTLFRELTEHSSKELKGFQSKLVEKQHRLAVNEINYKISIECLNSARDCYYSLNSSVLAINRNTIVRTGSPWIITGAMNLDEYYRKVFKYTINTEFEVIRDLLSRFVTLNGTISPEDVLLCEKAMSQIEAAKTNLQAILYDFRVHCHNSLVTNLYGKCEIESYKNRHYMNEQGTIITETSLKARRARKVRPFTDRENTT